MLPKQKVTLAERYKAVNPDVNPTYNHFHQTADHYIEQFGYDDQRQEIDTLQNAIEGIIDFSEYKQLLNPFNMDAGKEYKIGAKLRNHNILKGIAHLMLGEYARRTQDYSVTSSSAYEENKYKEGLTQQLRTYYEQQTINEFAKAGIPTGQPTEEQPPVNEVEESYKASYDRERVMRGQNAIDYIAQNTDAEDKFLEAYYDWVSVGRGYTYKCIRNNDVDFEYVPAKELYVPNESGVLFVEDRSFAVRRRIVPLSTIIDLYGDHLSEEDFDRLEAEYTESSGFGRVSATTRTGNRGFIVLPSLDANRDRVVSRDDEVYGYEVYHVQWRGFEKYGELLYQDELGQLHTIEVDDSYTLNEEAGDISIEWKWDTCICETTRIMDDIYCLDRVVEESRGRIAARGGKKLNYNGIIQRSKSGAIQSIIKDGFDYQLLINGLHFQLEKIINKNKDKVIVMPYGLIPRKKGISTKDAMYHMDATSILWVDETAPNASMAAQMIKVLDTSLSSYIKDVYEIIKMIKQEYWDAIGMNPQRYSDISQTSGKGVTEQAIVRSAIITYDVNRRMDKLIEKDFQGFLDLSKLAWVDGIKAKYLLSDGAEAFLELNADDALYHAESEYNVFVKNSTELSEGLQFLKSLAPQYAQQAGNFEAVAEIATNNNVEKLKHIIATIEDNNRKHEQVLAQTQGEQQKEIQEMINQDKQEERELEKYKIDRDYDKTVDSASIRSSNNSRNEPRPANEIEIASAYHKMQKDDNKELQRERELAQRDKELSLRNKDLNIKKSKATTNGK